jgi:hypothetical protein
MNVCYRPRLCKNAIESKYSAVDAFANATKIHPRAIYHAMRAHMVEQFLFLHSLGQKPTLAGTYPS